MKLPVSASDLDAINQQNLDSPGKITLVTDLLDSTPDPKPLFSVDDFDPATQDLLLAEIWTDQQATVVRKKIDWLLNCKTNNLDTLLELIQYQEILIEYYERC